MARKGTRTDIGPERNRLKLHIIEWVKGGHCRHPNMASTLYTTDNPYDDAFMNRIIWGYRHIDARAILIYVSIGKNLRMPVTIVNVIQDAFARGVLAGIATDFWDARDIILDDPEYAKRKRRTYAHGWKTQKEGSDEGLGEF